MIHDLRYGLCALLVVVGVSSASAQEPAAKDTAAPPAPVAPAEFNSPRATLETFLGQMKNLEEGTATDAEWGKVYAAMDASPVLGPARQDMAWRLYAVYVDGLGNPPAGTVAPDAGGAADLQRFELFPNHPDNPDVFAKVISDAGAPDAAIVLVRDPVDMAWKFSRETLEGLGKLVAWARPLGVSHGAGALRHIRSEAVRQWIPSGLQGRFFLGVELWQWIGLAVILFAALALDLISRMVLWRLFPRLISRFMENPGDEVVRATVRPVGLALGTGLFLVLLSSLGLIGTPQLILWVAGRVVLVSSLTWMAWVLTDLLSEAGLQRARRTPSALGDMIYPLLRKTAKLFILAMGTIYIADLFQFPIVPMLTSFGIAGLAVSFAAQDLVKNLFGGLAIFLDQPFKIGERIKFKGYDGTVEEVGFRVTRVRLLAGGHLVTVPNAWITTEPVENVDRRPFLQRNDNITVTYDTSPEKLRQAVQIIRDILEEPGIGEAIHPIIHGNPMPPRVFFNLLNADSLNIWVIYWHVPVDWWAFMDHTQRVNLRILEELAKARIELAYPTRVVLTKNIP